MDYIIFVPTRGRVDKQITLKQLPDSILRRVVIACHPGEESDHKRIWAGKVKGVLPISANHIGEVRQKCIDLSPTNHIIFVDDSLDFHVRSESEKGRTTKYPLKVMSSLHFEDSTLDYHMNGMFNWISDKLHTGRFGMVGVSRRSNNAHRLDQEIAHNDRVCSFWGINRILFNTLPNNPKFSDFPIKEDFYVMLHFLINGIPTITTYKYAYGRVGGSNSAGGCSLYRNIEMSVKTANMLKEQFPDFITLRNKGTKSWSGEFGNTTVDVTMHCKKAFESSKNKQNGRLF
jgi:hypothetical protein